MGCGVVIAAAGQGKRMKRDINKLFIEIDDKPILVHTIEKFNKETWVNEIVVVANPRELEIVKEMVEKFNLKVDVIVPGGKERQDSIRNALTHLNSDYIMIHDGARPFITSDVLNNLYREVIDRDAVVLGVRVKDTIKVVNQSNIIEDTPDRRNLWIIQTPQAFSLELINRAYENAQKENYLGTDDASLVERLGVSVHVIEGDYKNIKITTPEDVLVSQNFLNGSE